MGRFYSPSSARLIAVCQGARFRRDCGTDHVALRRRSPILSRMRLLFVLCLLALANAGTAHAGSARVAKGFQRGRPVKLTVVPLDWAIVEVATAQAFRSMRRAAAKSGVKLRIVSGFRTHAQQQELYRAWRRGYGNRAARPGFSNHQSGRALDIDIDRRSYRWLVANARRFGFKLTVPGEPWHWEYAPSRLARAKPRRR